MDRHVARFGGDAVILRGREGWRQGGTADDFGFSQGGFRVSGHRRCVNVYFAADGITFAIGAGLKGKAGAACCNAGSGAQVRLFMSSDLAVPSFENLNLTLLVGTQCFSYFGFWSFCLIDRLIRFCIDARMLQRIGSRDYRVDRR
jgi:hypothetical protein